MPLTLKDLDAWFPPRGPCGLCGHEDARHRIWDTMIASPDDDATVGANYGCEAPAVRAVRTVRPYQPKRAKRAPVLPRSPDPEG
jgi:hypothetical protein